MLQTLKFDLYKILKSRSMIFVWVITGLLLVSSPLMNYLLHQNSGSVMKSILGTGGSMPLSTWFFVAVFSTKDYSSGYIKNIWTSSNKFYFVISKLIYCLLFCMIYCILTFLLDWFFNLIFAGGIIHSSQDDFLVIHFIINELSIILNSTAIGSVTILLCVLVKKEYIALIIMSAYFFVLAGVVEIGNFIFGQAIDFRDFTIFLNQLNLMTIPLNIFEGIILPGFIVPGVYIIVSIFLSWIIVRSRKI